MSSLRGFRLFEFDYHPILAYLIPEKEYSDVIRKNITCCLYIQILLSGSYSTDLHSYNEFFWRRKIQLAAFLKTKWLMIFRFSEAHKFSRQITSFSFRTSFHWSYQYPTYLFITLSILSRNSFNHTNLQMRQIFNFGYLVRDQVKFFQFCQIFQSLNFPQTIMRHIKNFQINQRI